MKQENKVAREYEEEIDSLIREEISLDELTSKINKEEGIKTAEEIIETIFEEHLLVNEKDRCFECHNIIKDEDLTTEETPCPYGDTTVYQTLVDGYQCSVCGHSEKY